MLNVKITIWLFFVIRNKFFTKCHFLLKNLKFRKLLKNSYRKLTQAFRGHLEEKISVGGPALRVSRAETRLTVYRPPYIFLIFLIFLIFMFFLIFLIFLFFLISLASHLAGQVGNQENQEKHENQEKLEKQESGKNGTSENFGGTKKSSKWRLLDKWCIRAIRGHPEILERDPNYGKKQEIRKNWGYAKIRQHGKFWNSGTSGNSAAHPESSAARS